MFPVDSIKVSFSFLLRPRSRECSSLPTRLSWGVFFWLPDTHASIRHVAGRDVHRDRKRVHANIFDRGRARTVAWRVFGDRGGRSSACGPLWNV